MRHLPRILIAVGILVSGLAFAPYVDLPAERFSWQLYAGAYEPPRVQVSIQNFAFNPDTILIPVGITVRWTNDDTAAHTVTSKDGLFNSPTLAAVGSLASEDRFEFQFDTPGTYAYSCTFHPAMQGTVVVTSQINQTFLPIIIK